MKSRSEVTSEIVGIVEGLSMLQLLRLLSCAEALRRKDIEMGWVKNVQKLTG